jgi:hypothetical protein
MAFIILSLFFIFLKVDFIDGSCVYDKNSSMANCTGLESYKSISRQVRSLNLVDNCNFPINSWQNFTREFSHLQKIKFDPFCHNCLKIDDFFNGMNIEGRCIEKDHSNNMDLKSIVHEIAGIISLLIFLSILYLIRFIRKEILRYFTTKRYNIPIDFNASRNLS